VTNPRWLSIRQIVATGGTCVGDEVCDLEARRARWVRTGFAQASECGSVAASPAVAVMPGRADG